MGRYGCTFLFLLMCDEDGKTMLMKWFRKGVNVMKCYYKDPGLSLLLRSSLSRR